MPNPAKITARNKPLPSPSNPASRVYVEWKWSGTPMEAETVGGGACEVSCERFPSSEVPVEVSDESGGARGGLPCASAYFLLRIAGPLGSDLIRSAMSEQEGKSALAPKAKQQSDGEPPSAKAVHSNSTSPRLNNNGCADAAIGSVLTLLR
jgi:hypothetical protein